MPKIDLNQQLSTIPPYLNTNSIIKGDSKSIEKSENFQKEYRVFQLKKLQKTLSKEIDLFKRRKKEHNKRVDKYKILINYIKSEICQPKKK